MVNITNHQSFKVLFDKRNRKVQNVSEHVVFDIKNYPEWANKIMKATVVWGAKLECGHVVGPYIKKSFVPFPEKMNCSECSKRNK